MTKMINPTTGVEREITNTDMVRYKILTRAGFVLAEGYEVPVEPVFEAEPTLAEKVEEQGEDPDTIVAGKAAEKAVHEGPPAPGSGEGTPPLASKAAQEMIDEYELDPSEIEGTGEGGKINKPDVDTYLAGEDPGDGDEDEVE